LSTKRHVSWSPTALWISSATASTNDGMDRRVEEVLEDRLALPCGVCATSGWHCTAKGTVELVAYPVARSAPIRIGWQAGPVVVGSRGGRRVLSISRRIRSAYHYLEGLAERRDPSLMMRI
jgi:hypothetical protein